MQDRMCGRCDCVNRAGRNAKKEKWYKEPPSRFQGLIADTPLLDRGQGNPDASTWVLATVSRWPDRETEEARALRGHLAQADLQHLHEREQAGVAGLHPLVAHQVGAHKFWEILLGIDKSGVLQKGRGELWRRWLAGELFVTDTIKCTIAGPVPKKNLELFAEQCRVHLIMQFQSRMPGTLVIAGTIAQNQFEQAFNVSGVLKSDQFVSLPGSSARIIVAPDPEERGAAARWMALEGFLAAPRG